MSNPPHAALHQAPSRRFMPSPKFMRIWISRIIIAFLFGVAGAALYLFGKILLSTGFTAVLSSTCYSDEVCKNEFRALTFLLTIALILIPLFWLTALRNTWLSFLDAHTGEETQKLGEFFSDLTTILVPYFILGLGLLLELHKLEGADPTDGVDAVGAIAGIMILYALSLLGGFVLNQLALSRRSMEKSLSETTAKLNSASPWFAVQGKLSRSVAHSDPPAEHVLKMIETWAALYESEPSARTDGGNTGASFVRDACVSTLLTTYAREEQKDISGNLDTDRVPPQVWPTLFGTTAAGTAAFIATNISYYTTFLEQLIGQLYGASRAAPDTYPCMAVVTYVQPMHWWNWPAELSGLQKIYDPVLEYLTKQKAFAADHGRIFRRVLVQHRDETDSDLKMWRQDDSLLTALQEDRLCFLIDQSKKPKIVLLRSGPDRSGRPARPGTVLPASKLIVNSDRIIKPLHHATTATPQGEVYWAIELEKDEARCVCTGGHSEFGHCVQSVKMEYKQAMHPHGGTTEFFAAKGAFVKNKMRDIYDEAARGDALPGLEQCSDIMFLGLGRENDVWAETEPGWGCALLATMGPQTETMFLTVIHKPEAVRRLWAAVHNAFKAQATAGNVASLFTIN